MLALMCKVGCCATSLITLEQFQVSFCNPTWFS